MWTLIFIYCFINFQNVNALTLCEKVCTCQEADDNKGLVVDCGISYFSKVEGYVLPNSSFTLDLSYNYISTIQPASFLKSDELQELNLNGNELTEIHPQALQFPELRRLNLSENQLEYLDPKIFQSMPKLEYLNLAQNRFSSYLKLNFHYLINLKNLILDNNNLGPSFKNNMLFDQKGYGLTNKIEQLSLSSVNLSYVPKDFFDDAKTRLKSLIVSKNNLTEVFQLPINLVYLDLSDNPINAIKDVDFVNVPYLSELKLNHLRIREVPRYCLAPLTSLRHLEMEDNKNLTSFNILSFGSISLHDQRDFQLQNFSLRGSNLRILEIELRALLGTIKRLDLRGNPWKCDCHLAWMRNIEIPTEFQSDLRCATPAHLEGSSVLNYEYNTTTCALTVYTVKITTTFQRTWAMYSGTIVTVLVCIGLIILLLFLWVLRRLLCSRSPIVVHYDSVSTKNPDNFGSVPTTFHIS